MLDNSWVLDIEPMIFTKIKAKTQTKLKKKYPEINFTMDDASEENPKLPTVFLNFLQSAEVGADLVGESVNGILCSVDVRVTVSKTNGLADLRYINTEILNAFKSMRFQAKLPSHEASGTSTKSTVMRFERIIGQGQTL